MIDAEQIPDLEIQIRLKPQFQGLRGLEPLQIKLKPHLRGIVPHQLDLGMAQHFISKGFL
ncbi:MAG: hypothetical protein PHU14_00220 [Methylovulum sp.]|nr:hypothetical protein [Methylovulum sp.]